MCLAPCFKGCTDEEYGAEVRRVRNYFDSGGQSLQRELSLERDAASSNLEFENAAALHARVEKLAPVLSQPALPFPITRGNRRDLGISDEDLVRVKERCAAEEDLCLLGLRFTHDRNVPAERFQRLREELGDKFVAVELDSSPGNPHGHPKAAHSVLTNHLVDEPGTPTRDALDKVLDLFRSRLLTNSHG